MAKTNHKDKSQASYKREVIVNNEGISYSTHQSLITYRNEAQKICAQTVAKNDITFIYGPAGTGKTFVPMAYAVAALKAENKQIILVRPAIEATKSSGLGFLPGNLKEKMDPYMAPAYEALDKLLGGKESREAEINNGHITIATLEHMRGRTLENCIVIADEMQNADQEQLTMLLTRIGEGTTMIVCGDTEQTDLKGNEKGYFHKVGLRLSENKGIGFIEFNDKDIVRHRLIGPMLEGIREIKGGWEPKSAQPKSAANSNTPN